MKMAQKKDLFFSENFEYSPDEKYFTWGETDERYRTK